MHERCMKKVTGEIMTASELHNNTVHSVLYG